MTHLKAKVTFLLISNAVGKLISNFYFKNSYFLHDAVIQCTTQTICGYYTKILEEFYSNKRKMFFFWNLPSMT